MSAQANKKDEVIAQKSGWRAKSLMERLAEFERERAEAEKKKQAKK